MSRRQRRRQTKRRLAAGAGLTVGATLAGAGSAPAADFTVANLNDSGPGSLRQAVSDAETAPGADRILFQSGLTGTIALTSGDINISEGLEIQGPGASALRVDASDNFDGPGDSSRIFYASYFPEGETFSVSGLTLTGGVSNGTFRSDSFDAGGAIYAFDADLALSNMVITGNSTTGTFGGGGGVRANQNVSVLSSTISGNNAVSGGGGLAAADGILTIRNSTISGNHAGAQGGGLNTITSSQVHRVENSTFSGNTADETGGGVYAQMDTGATERLRFVGTTIAANSAAGPGGGLYSTGPGLAPVLENTLLANNSAGSGPDLFGPADSAFSLIRDTSGATVSETVPGSSIFNTDPQLGPLANNGGPTQTMALAKTSPAVDKGSAFGLGTDQRGSTRPFDFAATANSSAAGADGADIGAFELAPACQGRAATIVARAGQTTVGTAGADVIVGTDKRDVIKAGKGADRVCARSGNDKVSGGNGKDRINGEKGKDKLSGQKGKDTLKGGKGKDTLKGGKGRDTLKGGPGRDKLIGGPQRDKLAGGAGKDSQKQ